MVYENKQDWPEKYDINKLVSRQDDIDKIINGKKTSERRNDRYADSGDKIVLNGSTFVVDNVYPQKLKDVTDENGQQEGYADLEAMKESMSSIHYGAVCYPEAVVW